MSNAHGELKRRLADQVFDAVKDDLSSFEPFVSGEAYLVEITRVSRLWLQVKVLVPDRPPRYFSIQVSENL
jgi:hypothetical protein